MAMTPKWNTPFYKTIHTVTIQKSLLFRIFTIFQIYKIRKQYQDQWKNVHVSFSPEGDRIVFDYETSSLSGRK